ncbi:PTS mannose/fructose/sorbose/N-acetylgalactosamine transporter subunit IIC [Liquorilactobacillus mali]|uniref:PTS mannose/fructose/sorbose/N-acetylgalactosamine transporter subunit IIC n=1 Tax=Liquorilactobacillus mali TaxID=1618 RepID=UPI0029541895|nr:PTS sugar transporter subunit IIC [Liquorilactobacillus mali]MDV7757533.1 PTS sugar transporter subunit IIC [Liquorilactobacillus mali]
MGLSVLQVLLLTLLAYIQPIEWFTTQITAQNTIIYGFAAGLILGDVKTGLLIGGTLQLMSLGVAAIGGSSVPSYPVAAIIATTISITTGKGLAAGLALGLPVGMLVIQLDIVIKLINSYIGKKATDALHAKKFSSMRKIIPISTWILGLENAIPAFLAIIFGKSLVESILNALPAWFTTGLNITAAMLPAVGIAVLLTFMPLKRYVPYLLFGFVMSAYLNMPVMGIAIVGIGFAIETYKKNLNTAKDTTTNIYNVSSTNKEDMEDE